MRDLILFLSLLQTIFASLFSLKPPSQDDFYKAPAGFKAAKPGDILKTRKSPNKPSSLYAPVEVQNSWQLLVRSEDSFGNPNAFVTTIIQPKNADPSKVVSYQNWEDASNINCSPSYGSQLGAPLSTILTQLDMTFIVPPLKSGYYVVLPDYEGPKSTFGVGRQSGKATLDSIKAVLKTKDFSGINDDAKVVLWGYSGGSFASGWAAVLQPEYAPELKDNLIGAALGGFAANLTGIAESVDGEVFSGFIPLALNGIANEYPDFKKRLYEEVKPGAKADLQKGAENCLAASLISYPMYQYFTGPRRVFEKGWSLLEDKTIGKTLEDNLLIALSKEHMPQIPIFVYHGTIDKIIPIKDSLKIYKNWCDWGIGSFEFSEDKSNGHTTETVVGAPAALTWIDARFAGKPAVEGCSFTTRASNFLYPNISESAASYFKGIYQTILRSKLGSGVTSDDVSVNGLRSLYHT
ncbi:lipase 6 [Candida albicans P34048]|nr:lipase 6 [Candida albicans P94015]KGU32149.1 lipase 6 [Candida albicans P34048]